jgi:hypothetical protein
MCMCDVVELRDNDMNDVFRVPVPRWEFWSVVMVEVVMYTLCVCVAVWIGRETRVRCAIYDIRVL